jgi:hypothetical protein
LGEEEYTYQLAPVGGLAPFVWSAEGSFPSGMAVDSMGVIHLRPQALGTDSIQVTVRDALGQAAHAAVGVQTVLPPITLDAVLNAVTGGAALGDVPARALDLVGNHNGRLDIGDVVRWRQLTAGPNANSSAPDAERAP